MIISELKIHQLRNLSSLNVTLNPRFNFIFGPNGSGKTSILEALYLLSRGQSFRCSEISPMITHHESALTVFARTTNETNISIQKSSVKPTLIKLNNQFCTNTSQLAYLIPCQIIYADIFQIIDAGSSVRRSLLDWGLFHVEQEYLNLLKNYKRVLKQRNTLLKTQSPYSQFIPWDQQLNHLANQLHSLRLSYMEQWSVGFLKILGQLTDISCSIRYCKGWDKKELGKSLEEILEEQFISDRQKSYTQYGAHQADILIETQHARARHSLSRGQQKLVLIALKLSQGQLLEKDCLYLFDDLSAELDAFHQNKLLHYLSKEKGQYVITNNSVIDFSQYCAAEEVNVHCLS